MYEKPATAIERKCHFIRPNSASTTYRIVEKLDVVMLGFSIASMPFFDVNDEPKVK